MCSRIARISKPDVAFVHYFGRALTLRRVLMCIMCLCKCNSSKAQQGQKLRETLGPGIHLT